MRREYIQKQMFGVLTLTSSNIFKESFNNQWKAMPDKVRDVICYFQTLIELKKNVDENHDCTGKAYFKTNIGNNYKVTLSLKINIKIDPYENIALIHECAHIYDYVMSELGVKDYRKESDKQYKKNEHYYGSYGSTDKDEFYAEKMRNESLKNVKRVSVDTFAKYIQNNCKYKINMDPSEDNSFICIDIDTNEDYPFEVIEINGIEYLNGYPGEKFDEEVVLKILEDNGKFPKEMPDELILGWC